MITSDPIVSKLKLMNSEENMERPEATTNADMQEELSEGALHSGNLSRRGYIDTSNHLNGDIMLPRSHNPT